MNRQYTCQATDYRMIVRKAATYPRFSAYWGYAWRANTRENAQATCLMQFHLKPTRRCNAA